MVIKKIRDHGARVIGKTKEHGTKDAGYKAKTDRSIPVVILRRGDS